MTRFTRFAMAWALMALAAQFAGKARAQDWPQRPVRIVVITPPGGFPDFAARMLATHMKDPLGQQVVVENKPGAGGNIAASCGRRGGAGRLYAAPHRQQPRHQRNQIAKSRLRLRQELLPDRLDRDLQHAAGRKPDAAREDCRRCPGSGARQARHAVHGGPADRHAGPSRRRAVRAARQGQYDVRALQRRDTGTARPLDRPS